MKKKRGKPCAVPTCPAIVGRWEKHCPVHRRLAHEQLRALIHRLMGGRA